MEIKINLLNFVPLSIIKQNLYFKNNAFGLLEIHKVISYKLSDLLRSTSDTTVHGYTWKASFPSRKYGRSFQHDSIRWLNWANSDIWSAEYFMWTCSWYSSRDLNMGKTFAKWVLKYLNVDQKPARVEASRSICDRLKEGADFLSRVVAMDEA